MRIFATFALLAAAASAHGPHGHHGPHSRSLSRHGEEHGEQSPAVHDLQKQLAEQLLLVHKYCDGEVKDYCGGAEPAPPPIALGAPSIEEEEAPAHVWVFFHTAGRKLFRVMDGEDENHSDHEHGPRDSMDHDLAATTSHGPGRDKTRGRGHGHGGCHQMQQTVPFYGAEVEETNKCVESMVEDESVSFNCRASIHNALVVNQAINNQILMEEYGAFFAGLFSFIFILILIYAVVAFAFAPHRNAAMKARRLRRAVVESVYEDEEIRALVEKKLEADIGDVAPFPENVTVPKEDCGCVSCFRKLTRGLIYAFLFLMVLSSPFLSIIAIFFMAVKCARAMCRSRRAAAAAADYKPVEGYPASFAGDVELKRPVVFVGVPTVV